MTVMDEKKKLYSFFLVISLNYTIAFINAFIYMQQRIRDEETFEYVHNDQAGLQQIMHFPLIK